MSSVSNVDVVLFKGEKIDDESEGSANEPESSAPGEPKDDDSNKSSRPWTIGEHRIVTETSRWTIDVLVQVFAKDKYDLNPEYQRRRRWGVDRKSRLVESLILNVPLPPIFLYEVELSRYEVMDGLQRLTTLLDFYNGDFELEKLELLSELNGKRYSELPNNARRQLDRSSLSAIVLLHESIKNPEQLIRMKQIVFDRINSGGVKLSCQEARNALMPGPMNKLSIELSEMQSYRVCWGLPPIEELSDVKDTHSGAEEEPDEEEDTTKITKAELKAEERAIQDFRSMTDVENVVRFLAIRQRRRYAKLAQRDYYDLYVRKGNEFNDTTLGQLKEHFRRTFDLLEEVLGENAFRRWNGNTWTAKRSTLVYDAISSAFAARLNRESEIRDKKNLIVKELKNAYVENRKNFNASYSSYTYHVQRVEWLVTAIDKALE